MTESSAQFAVTARDTARAHPLALGAAAAAVGLALLARNRLAKARVDLGDDLGNYTDYDDGFGFAETAPEASEPRQRARIAAPTKEEARRRNARQSSRFDPDRPCRRCRARRDLPRHRCRTPRIGRCRHPVWVTPRATPPAAPPMNWVLQRATRAETRPFQRRLTSFSSPFGPCIRSNIPRIGTIFTPCSPYQPHYACLNAAFQEPLPDDCPTFSLRFRCSAVVVAARAGPADHPRHRHRTGRRAKRRERRRPRCIALCPVPRR